MHVSSSRKISIFGTSDLNSRMKYKISVISIIFLLNYGLAESSIFHIPFEIKENVMIVSATINGESQKFIFDTGAQSLVINRKYISDNYHKSEKNYDIKGINSRFVNNEEYEIKDFNFGEISINNFSALMLDISLLEEHTRTEIFGLIGYSVFKSFDILIDFKDKYITFIPSGEFMSFWNMNIINQQFEKIPFKRYDHIPIIDARAGEKEIKLGFDTGSARTIIDKNALKLIRYELSNISEQQIIGIENKNVTISGAKIRNLEIGNSSFSNLDILINDLSHLNKNGRIDGLIGYDLLARYKVLVSYQNKFITLIK